MLTWPAILAARDGGYSMFVRSLSGGQALSGSEQVQPQLHDRWDAQFAFPLHGRQDRKEALRALLFGLRGRANTVLLPDFDLFGVPRGPLAMTVEDPVFVQRWPAFAGTVREYAALADVTGTLVVAANGVVTFTPDGRAPRAGEYLTLAGVRHRILTASAAGADVVLMLEGGVGAAVTAQTLALAAINATQVDVGFSAGGPPRIGHHFSFGSRMYGVQAVAALAENQYRLTLWPWLRHEIPQGTVANFSTPGCEMRLASDAEGADALRALDKMRHGTITLRFDEAPV
jgi:hypothetical protein